MYLTTEDFISGVSSNFSFLSEYGFQELGYEPSASKRGYYYFYSTNSLTVLIHYSLTNDWIDVDFIHEANAKKTMTNRNNSLALRVFLFSNGIKGYEEIMPKSIDFTQSVSIVGDRVKTLCKPVLTGEVKITDKEALANL